MQHQPIFNAPRIVIIMIILFCSIHIGLELSRPEIRNEALIFFAFIPLRFTASGVQFELSAFIKALSFVSHSFLHGDYTHLGLNSVWFLVFGTPLARRWPLGHFLVFYCLCAIGGAALYWLFNLKAEGIMIGASGAISGLIAASFRFMFSHEQALSLKEMFASRFIQNFFAFWLFFNVFLAMMMQNVAWEAHLGGFLIGLFAFPLFERGLK